ncbi:MAG: capsule assembly Wzi family protein [Terracidiphilus sp.]
MNRHVTMARAIQNAVVLAGLMLIAVASLPAEQPTAPQGAGQSEHDSNLSVNVCDPSTLGSPYIPVDSWVYSAVLRLYSMGYLDRVYLGMRPWTRASLSHMLEDTDAEIEDANTYEDSTADEAQDIYATLIRFLHYNAGMQCLTHQGNSHIESAYTVARTISGTPLRDSFHLGSTIINDYGRPFENGINNYSGASGYAIAGRFTLYMRGEFQGAHSTAGYSQVLAQVLSSGDDTTYTDPTTQVTNYFLSQNTIPMGPIAATADGRFIEAYLSAHVLNHEVSFGKQDNWLGPGSGGGMAYSNNAENIYSFRINRIEPLYIPLLSKILGHFRYDFMVGSLFGHTYMPNPAFLANPSPTLPNVINPGNPWVHVEKVSFKPTRDLEFGFERTVIWGGHGHEPVTLHTFLHSFFSFDAVTSAVKYTAQDPGARFGAFDFTYRLPFPRNWLTLYTDSEAHDTVSPLFKPLHGCFRPGLYLSHVPNIPKLDLRVEGVDTDSSVPSSATYLGSIGGLYQYWEVIQKQGYTNHGQLLGDWIGREDKGGQGWITYHLSGNEWLQVGVRNQKASKDFIPGGTTLNDINFQVVKRVGKDFEVNGRFALEHWRAPIYLPTQQTVATTSIQLTWFPEWKIRF